LTSRVAVVPFRGAPEWDRQRREFETSVPRIEVTDDYSALPEARGLVRDRVALATEESARPLDESRRCETGRLEYFWATASAPVLDRGCVIKGLIAPNSLIVIYGESNSGKTYFAFGLAVDIASGRHWRGRKVEKGLVMYIAGEGEAGIKNRIAAHRERSLLADGAPLAIVRRAADFLATAGDVSDLIDLIAAAETECGEKCSLIVVDTLSRAMAGADENSAEAMTTVIANADLVRRETGAAVAFIHHAGKDAARGARGHSSLRAAADTEILVEGQSGRRTATVVKQRDLPGGEVFGFDLDVVHLGTDAEGDPVTACVVRQSDDAEIAPKSKPGGRNQEKAITALREWCRANDGDHIPADALTAAFKSQGITRQRKPEVLNWLVNAGMLAPSVGGHRLNKEALR
jgi:hypothetical protein